MGFMGNGCPDDLLLRIFFSCWGIGFRRWLVVSYHEAYSAAGGMGFGWWLVEHYLPYHVDCPDGCGLGETAGGG